MNKAIRLSLFCLGLVFYGHVLASDDKPGNDSPSSPTSTEIPAEDSSAQACPPRVSDTSMNLLKTHIQTLVEELNNAKKAYEDVAVRQQEILKDKQSLDVSNTSDEKLKLDKEAVQKYETLEKIEAKLKNFGVPIPIKEDFNVDQLNQDAVAELLKKVFTSLDHEQKQPQPASNQTKSPTSTGSSSRDQKQEASIPNFVFMGGSHLRTSGCHIPMQYSQIIPSLFGLPLTSANHSRTSSIFSPPDYIGSSASTASSPQFPPHLKPLASHDIFNQFQKYTKSQDEALRVLSVALQRHLFMLEAERTGKSKDFSQCSPRILIVGPPGSGKTSTIEKMAELSNLPYAITDATQLSPTGYKGFSISNIFTFLLNKAFDLVKEAKIPLGKQAETAKNWAERGIIFIDEVDKLCRSSRSKDSQDTSSDMDAFYTKVQHELLMCVQGSKAYHVEGHLETWDTTKMMFILGGAFSGIENRKDLSVRDYVVKQAGLNDQLVGRLHFVTEFYPLTREALEDILRNSGNSILRDMQKMWKSIYDVELQFEEPCYKDIAELAQKSGEGARSLSKIVNELMLPFEQEVLSHRGMTVLIKQEDLKMIKEKYSKNTNPQALTLPYYS